MKNKLILISTFIIAFVFIIACKKNRFPCIHGKGDVITQTRNETGFNRVVLETDATVHIIQGSEYKIELRGQKNVLESIVTEVEGDELHIYSHRCIVEKSGSLNFYITMPDIVVLKTSGSGKIYSPDTLNCTNLELSISGSGDIDICTNVSGTLDATISGSGNIELNGSCNNEHLTISGSGDVKAFYMNASDCHTKISGSGNLKVFVSKSLWVDISGSGNVYYRGNPVIESVDISGSGSLINDN